MKAAETVNMAARGRVSWGELLLGPKRTAVWTICLGVGLHAINWFVINTVTPSIVLELDGAKLLSWVTAFYLVFSIVGSSGAAFLKARLGLRTVLIGASLAAALGSSIMAAAPTMEIVLFGRIVQGFAEGLIIALCYIIAADVVGEDALPSLFGLLAMVWATATILGPILGGVLAEIWSWRVAAGALAPVAGLFMILALAVFPARGGNGTRGWPLLRMTLLTGGALAVCVASESRAPSVALVLVVGALFALWLGLHLDRRARTPLFPARLLSLRPASSVGLWILLLMPVAESSVFLFAPYVAQIHFGLSVLHAGQVASATAFGWSIAAMAVARLGDRAVSKLIVLGPIVLTLSMFVLAWSVERDSLPIMIAALTACGIGFGISNGFLCQRTIGASDPAERDVASGAIPTVEGIGAALGAAFAGIIAVAAGFPVADPSPRPITIAFLIGGLLGVPAILAAWRFARQTSTVPVAE